MSILIMGRMRVLRVGFNVFTLEEFHHFLELVSEGGNVLGEGVLELLVKGVNALV
jgi:hypothetical protein